MMLETNFATRQRFIGLLGFTTTYQLGLFVLYIWPYVLDLIITTH